MWIIISIGLSLPRVSPVERELRGSPKIRVSPMSIARGTIWGNKREIRGKFRVFYEGGESYFKGVRLLSRFSLNRFCRFLVNLVFIGQRHKLCFRQPNSFNY
jgi:hypothetical protein